MSTMPLDIVMPFWGDFGHLREAVESVLAQEDGDWRLVVIDDCYPDRAPAEWVLGLEDPRVRLVTNPENLGVSRNFSKAVRLAESDFVVIMGCDDRLLPGFVGRVKHLSEQYPDAGMIQPGVAVIDERGRRSHPVADFVKKLVSPRGARPYLFSGESAAVSVLRGNWAYFPSIAWRRALIVDGFREDFRVVQDLAMIVNLLERGYGFVIDDEVVFEYRRHRASVSSSLTANAAKYVEERRLFAEAMEGARRLLWRRARRAANCHLTSRLSALSEVPAGLLAGRWRALGALVRHGLGTTRP